MRHGYVLIFRSSAPDKIILPPGLQAARARACGICSFASLVRYSSARPFQAALAAKPGRL